MRVFRVRAYGKGGSASSQNDYQVVGHRAHGPGVLVLEEGSGWLIAENGSRQEISAKTVVMWDAGDWVEFGTNNSSLFKFRDYWETVESDQDWQARANEAFGGRASG